MNEGDRQRLQVRYEIEIETSASYARHKEYMRWAVAAVEAARECEQAGEPLSALALLTFAKSMVGEKA